MKMIKLTPLLVFVFFTQLTGMSSEVKESKEQTNFSRGLKLSTIKAWIKTQQPHNKMLCKPALSPCKQSELLLGMYYEKKHQWRTQIEKIKIEHELHDLTRLKFLLSDLVTEYNTGSRCQPLTAQFKQAIEDNLTSVLARCGLEQIHFNRILNGFMTIIDSVAKNKLDNNMFTQTNRLLNFLIADRQKSCKFVE